MTKRILGAVAAALVLAGASAEVKGQRPAQGPEIWRLDCGDIQVTDLNVFSDTFAYTGQQKRIVGSCYLIKHGEQYLLWDTGLSGDLAGQTSESGPFRLSLRERILPQLARINLTPEQIGFVGISHYHFDHIGQLADFPRATLLIGSEDWDAVRAEGAPQGLAAPFQSWISGGSTVQAVSGDHDVFGDGSVVMLNLPGHTPGHHGLLVRLAGGRTLLLSGDQFHFTEQIANNGVPGFNTSRADTLASSARLLSIARSLDAELVIQHEPNDIGKVPAIPGAGH